MKWWSVARRRGERVDARVARGEGHGFAYERVRRVFYRIWRRWWSVAPGVYYQDLLLWWRARGLARRLVAHCGVCSRHGVSARLAEALL